MSSFKDWDEDEDLYDWGSQFGSFQPKRQNQPDKPKEPKESVVVKAPEPSAQSDTLTAEAIVPPDVNDAEDNHAEESPHHTRPLIQNELQKLSTDQGTCVAIVDRLLERFQQIISTCNNSQLPKGVHTTQSLLGKVKAVATATKALADYYLETNAEEHFQSLKESQLKSFAAITFRNMTFREATIQKVMDNLEKLIQEGEGRVVLNQQTRVIKEQCGKMFGFAEQQAKAYAKALESYTPDQNAMVLQERFARRGDSGVMSSIDTTLAIAGTSLVLTEDAPAMIDALNSNDTNSIVRLQQKLIDFIFDKI